MDCLNLYPTPCLLTALYLYFLASVESFIPRTQLNSYFLHQATPVYCSPHSHTLRHHVDYLGGGGAGRKRVHQKSCSVRAGSFKALASSKDRNWRLAYTRFTCAQQSLEVEPTKTGLELHMVVSTLGLSSPFSRPAQGLQALSHWTATPSCSSPLQFSKHAFLRWRPVCVIFMWGNGWITTEQHPEFPTALGRWKTLKNREHVLKCSLHRHHALPPFCQVRELYGLLATASKPDVWAGILIPLLISCVTTSRKTSVPQFPFL